MDKMKNVFGEEGVYACPAGFPFISRHCKRISESLQPDLHKKITYSFEQRELESFFKNTVLKNSSAQITFYEVDESYFELTIVAIKNVILKGRGFWEKITVRGYLRAHNNEQILDILVDGLYTTGIGGPPSIDTQYDNNFEPDYLNSLNDFAKICTQKFVSNF